MVIDPDKLLEDLTPEQRQAVTTIDGPLLIVAGAGSGKTRVITRRVAWLMAQGIPGPSILAITFTNKAAGEMKSRVSSLLGRALRDWGRLDQPDAVICTFHSLCLRILKHYAPEVGLPPNFSIYDSADQDRLLKEAIKAIDLSTSNFPLPTVQSKISEAKNKLRGPEAFASAAQDFHSRSVARIYTRYQKLLAQNNALDFDDLLMKTAESFRQHPRILAALQERFQYVLIDEYQDTNHAQYIIAHLLAMKHNNICVVGDPDQSVYAWRGADIQNILDFEQDYPKATVIRLEQNYRSTQTILRVASKLIAHNRRRKDKTLWTANAAGDKASLLIAGDEHEEARCVAHSLRRIKEAHNLQWSQLAIFYRVNALSRVMEDAMRRAGIPYRIARGVDFYHRKEIKDVLAYLRLIANPADQISLQRIANTPARGISDATLRQLEVHAISRSQGIYASMSDVTGVPNLNARAQNSVASFVRMVERWRQLLAQQADRSWYSPTGKGRITTLMEDVVSTSGLEAYLRKIGATELSELENVNELITSASEYDDQNPEGSLEDYLARISLVSDQDMLKDAGGAVTLMTLHAAKGLEFPVVAMIGMEEGILPHARVTDQREPSDDALEEERRLCFVGITRAQHHLLFSQARFRMVRGLRDRTIASRFLAELPAEDIDVHDASGVPLDDRPARREAAEGDSARLAGEFRRGQMVRHPSFGIGRIAEISNMGQQTRAVVEFQRAGRKTLILQYAKLQPVG